MADNFSTPGGTKRKDRTPTPDFERRGGFLAKSLRGNPIEIQGMAEEAEITPQNPQKSTNKPLTFTFMSDKVSTILPGPGVINIDNVVDLMQDAPPWARVFRDEIRSLCRVITNMSESDKYTDTRITELEEDNSKLNHEAGISKNKIEVLSNKLERMEIRFDALEEKVLRHEVQARKCNLLFYGIAEDGRDSWLECRRKIDRALANTSIRMDPQQIKIDKVHRLGAPPGNNRQRNSRPRPIIVAFNWNAERDMVWQLRGELKSRGISLEEDQPTEIQSRRARLLPIYKKALSMSEHKKRTFLNGDQLTISGQHFTVDNLHQLPQELDPRYIATQTQDDVTIFFSQNSPLSNHHPSPMVVENKSYLCNEQFYFAKKCDKLGDDAALHRVLSTKDPKVMLREGRKATNFTGFVWEDVEMNIMEQGAKAKFNQNRALRDFLMETENNWIGESAPNNKKWGTGFYMGAPDAYNHNFWAENALGQILMKIRDSYTDV